MSFSPYVEPSKTDLTWKKGIAIVVVMSLVFVELAFRVVRLPAVDRWIDPAAFELAQAHVEPHPYLSYALKPGWATPTGSKFQAGHNQLGFRGDDFEPEKDDDVFRVLCLGSGSTYGIGASSDAATWPARPARRSRGSAPSRTTATLRSSRARRTTTTRPPGCGTATAMVSPIMARACRVADVVGS